MKRLALMFAVFVACIAAGSARADGDPASDYLLGSQVFLPFDAKIPKAKEQELIATRIGYPFARARFTVVSSRCASDFEMPRSGGTNVCRVSR